MEKLYAVMGELYEPQMSDGMTIEEFKLQNQAMNSILASSLNVELVYVILTSVTSFSKVELANDDFDTNRLAGLVITNGINQDPIQEIDINLPYYELERQVISECNKTRMQVL